MPKLRYHARSGAVVPLPDEFDLLDIDFFRPASLGGKSRWETWGDLFAYWRVVREAVLAEGGPTPFIERAYQAVGGDAAVLDRAPLCPGCCSQWQDRDAEPLVPLTGGECDSCISQHAWYARWARQGRGG